MYLPSRLQKYAGIGRVVSAVIGFAASKASAVRLTQILRVPLNGLTKAMNLPSGEIWAPEISGSPKNSSRSIIGGRPFDCAGVWIGARTSVSAAQNMATIRRMNFERSCENTFDLMRTSFIVLDRY